MKKTIVTWLALGLAGFILLPWHMTEDGLFDTVWITDGIAATGLFSTFAGQWWLAPAGLALVVGLILQFTIAEPVRRARLTLGTALSGLFCIALQGLVIVRAGPRIFEGLLTGDVALAGQAGMGAGAGICALALLFAATISLSQTGKGQGDAFVVSTIGLIIALVGIFVFFPVVHILVRAFEVEGGYSLTQFFPRFISSDIWGLGCLIGPRSCGVAINSLFLGVNAVVAEDGAEVADLVQSDVHAIGYLSHAQKRGAVPLTLISDCGLPVIPEAFSARTKEYGLLQRLYFYNRADGLDPKAKALLEYTLSEGADPLIQETAYFDLGVESRSQAADSPRAKILRNTNAGPYETSFIEEMLEDMVSHDRLSTTFRFRTGSSKLDERGRLNMARLASYLEAMPAGTQIKLAGFIDDVGAFEANRALSLGRAETARAEFEVFAGTRLDRIEMAAVGYGKIAPSQCNTTEQGRAINRRVEVWVNATAEEALLGQLGI